VTVIRSAVDAFVSEATPGQNNGDAARLRLNGGGGVTKYAYLFFPQPFPEGATVTSAILRLTLAGTWVGTRTLTAKRLTEAWKESRVSWNAKPAASGTNAGSVSVSSAAAGDVVEIDVEAMLQDVAEGETWFGIRLEVSSGGDFLIHSSDAAQIEVWPELEIEWNEPPDPPTNLSPSGGFAVSVAKPVLTWRFRDTSEEGQQAHSRVQISTDETFASTDYDSNKQPNVNSSWDLSGTAYAGLSDGGSTYWRVKVWDDTGLESDWSDVVEMSRVSQGTLTITNPPAAPNNYVEETTPPIAWTLTGRTQEMARVILWELLPGDHIRELWRMPTTVTDETSVTIPKNLLFSGRTYRVRVETWDTESRQATPGDRLQLREEREFTYERSGDPSPVSSLTAEVDGRKVTLTWERATQPDYFSIREDGEEREQRVEPTDVFVSGTSYSLEWWRSAGGTEHTYEVEAVVLDGGKLLHSDDNATVTAEPSQEGIALVDDSDITAPIVVEIWDDREPDIGIGETAETFYPVGSRKPVRIRESIRGFEGTVSGFIITKEERDSFLEMIREGSELRLLLADLNFPVVLGAAAPVPLAESKKRWDMSAEFMQVGEFTF
jgi:hypothetical protein